MITHHNIEEYLIRYVENDLSVEEQHQLKEFLNRYPEYREDLKAFQETVLVPSSEWIFVHKQQLLRQDGHSRILMIPVLWRVAAALLLTASLIAAYFYYTTQSDTTSVELAGISRRNEQALQTQSDPIAEIVLSENGQSPSVTEKRPNEKVLNNRNKYINNTSPKKNMIQPVTNSMDTTPYYQLQQEFKIVSAPHQLCEFNNQESETLNPPTQMHTSTPEYRPSKNLSKVSRWLRRNGKEKLADGIDYVTQLKDKDIEISYTSRYINFQKSFSLSKY